MKFFQQFCHFILCHSPAWISLCVLLTPLCGGLSELAERRGKMSLSSPLSLLKTVWLGNGSFLWKLWRACSSSLKREATITGPKQRWELYLHMKQSQWCQFTQWRAIWSVISLHSLLPSTFKASMLQPSFSPLLTLLSCLGSSSWPWLVSCTYLSGFPPWNLLAPSMTPQSLCCDSSSFKALSISARRLSNRRGSCVRPRIT